MHKLLFDNNISHRVINKLNKTYPNSTHVMLENLDLSTDIEIWQYAKNNGYTIVTKDSDFNDISIYRGTPPKVIWLKIGNCRVDDIVNIMIKFKEEISAFLDDTDSSILEL